MRGDQPVARLFPESLKSLLVVASMEMPTEVGGEELSAFASSLRTLLPHLTAIRLRAHLQNCSTHIQML